MCRKKFSSRFCLVFALSMIALFTVCSKNAMAYSNYSSYSIWDDISDYLGLWFCIHAVVATIVYLGGREKGYGEFKYFIICFLFGIFGEIYLAVLPDLILRKQNEMILKLLNGENEQDNQDQKTQQNTNTANATKTNSSVNVQNANAVKHTTTNNVKTAQPQSQVKQQVRSQQPQQQVRTQEQLKQLQAQRAKIQAQKLQQMKQQAAQQEKPMQKTNVNSTNNSSATQQKQTNQ